MRLLYVVHRYAPYPGGSEYNVQRMAEESVRRGHEVTVLAGAHGGDLNGVRVTSDFAALDETWDMVIVHGGDVPMQDTVLRRAGGIASPILFMLIKPSESRVYRYAMDACALIACATEEDWDLVRRHQVEDRAVPFRYGIPRATATGTPGVFREKFGIPRDRRMFLSCGGYWPNKRMRQLAAAFEEAGLDDAVLVTTGYENPFGEMPEPSERVFPLILPDPADVADAMADADVYVMNSDSEGFGLVLLECMLNRTPWIARDMAGARVLQRFGTTYTEEAELPAVLAGFTRDEAKVDAAQQYVLEHHLIENMVDDILAAAQRLSRGQAPVAAAESATRPAAAKQHDDETSCEIVSSRGILKSCDIHPQHPVSSTRECYEYPWHEVRRGQTVYIQTTALRSFLATALPGIREPFILVTGDCDESAPFDMLSEEEWAALASDPRLIHWYSQNCTAPLAGRLSQIPIGLDYHTLADRGRRSWWGPPATPREQERSLVAVRGDAPPFAERQPKCFANFHFTIAGARYGWDRVDAISGVARDAVAYQRVPVSRHETWQHQSGYAFVLSPFGNGLDCHRTWEALALDCVPIVKTSPLDPLFDGLNVLIVDAWEQVTGEFLLSAHERFSQLAPSSDAPRLRLDHWAQVIASARDESGA